MPQTWGVPVEEIVRGMNMGCARSIRHRLPAGDDGGISKGREEHQE